MTDRRDDTPAEPPERPAADRSCPDRSAPDASERSGRPDRSGPERSGPEPKSPAEHEAPPQHEAPQHEPAQQGARREPNPPLSDRDFEHRFADIVAQWHRDGLPDVRVDPQAPGGGEPVGEITPAQRDAPTDPGGPDPIRPPTALPEPTPWRVHTPPPDPDDEDYVPPPPRPLPTSGDLGFWAALFGLVAGPLWLIYIAVADPGGSRLAVGLALALTVGGFAIVVARLPRGRRDDDDDDGAVV